MQRTAVEATGLVGVVFTEDPNRPKPGVLVLGGSDGSIPEQVARMLATDGFTALALAYFGSSGLPGRLVEIPLEYVEAALGWLGEHPAVVGDHLGAVGGSKGAELALLAAATFPSRIGAVVAYAPSAVVFPGIDLFGTSNRSSWSYQGEPVPFAPYPRGARPSLSRRGLSVAPMYEAALRDGAAVGRAAIRVEQIDGPILLISGDDDRMWPASRMAQMVVARMNEFGRGDGVTHLRYAQAGHRLNPHGSAKGMGHLRVLFDLGGSPQADQHAALDAWPRAVALLKAALA